MRGSYEVRGKILLRIWIIPNLGNFILKGILGKFYYKDLINFLFLFFGYNLSE
jgi:hypothetical protein